MKLDLYVFKGCPYCHRVIRYLNKKNIQDVTIHDIHRNEEDRQTLISVGGMEQVPCLFIDGKPLYESLEIIDWFKNRY